MRHLGWFLEEHPTAFRKSLQRLACAELRVRSGSDRDEADLPRMPARGGSASSRRASKRGERDDISAGYQGSGTAVDCG